MEKNLKFGSVADAAAFLAGDDAIKKSVEKEIEQSQIINSLLKLRMRRGISQTELSKSMGCDSSKISRMEAGNDLQLKIGDVMQYASALGVEMNMIFEDKTLPVTEQIKSHVYSIHEELEQLVGIAKQVDGDELIIEKINAFYGEVLLNFLLRFTDSHKKLRIVSGDESSEQHTIEKKIPEKDTSKEHSRC
ncbi:MAG: helix-turn-helix domain-containing protein [Chlorobiales bacterium]|nr:helix-turn-helix domain-containing protein [Chlorobiales bacterium]